MWILSFRWHCFLLHMIWYTTVDAMCALTGWFKIKCKPNVWVFVLMQFLFDTYTVYTYTMFCFVLYRNVEKQVLNNMRKCWIYRCPAPLKWPYCVKCSVSDRKEQRRKYARQMDATVSFFFVFIIIFLWRGFQTNRFKSFDTQPMDI